MLTELGPFMGDPIIAQEALNIFVYRHAYTIRPIYNKNFLLKKLKEKGK